MKRQELHPASEGSILGLRRDSVLMNLNVLGGVEALQETCSCLVGWRQLVPQVLQRLRDSEHIVWHLATVPTHRHCQTQVPVLRVTDAQVLV